MAEAKINGSEGSKLIQELNNQFANTRTQLDSIRNYIESIKASDKFEQEIFPAKLLIWLLKVNNIKTKLKIWLFTLRKVIYISSLTRI